MKFKGQTCVYCNERPSTRNGDHIFARQFFLEADRADPPKVPACAICNSKKSEIEGYLATILLFGGRQPGALENLTKNGPRRLTGNKRLHGEILRGTDTAWLRDRSGLMVRTRTVPLDAEKVIDLFKFIVPALVFHHWTVRLSDDDFVDVLFPTPAQERALVELSSYRSESVVHNNLGNGTFEYYGKQGTDNAAISIWRFSLCGGLTMTNSASRELAVSNVWAMTGPREIDRRADERLKATGRILLGAQTLS